jgi:hypothetical protein
MPYPQPDGANGNAVWGLLAAGAVLLALLVVGATVGIVIIVLGANPGEAVAENKKPPRGEQRHTELRQSRNGETVKKAIDPEEKTTPPDSPENKVAPAEKETPKETKSTALVRETPESPKVPPTEQKKTTRPAPPDLRLPSEKDNGTKTPGPTVPTEKGKEPGTQPAGPGSGTQPAPKEETVELSGGRVGTMMVGGLLPVERVDDSKKFLLPLSQPVSDLVHRVTNFKAGEAKSKKLRLAVSTPMWDNIGALLEKLGPGFRYTTIRQDDVDDPGRLDAFDVVFLNCGGGVVIQPNSPAQKNLRQYVETGGTVYASDLQYQNLITTFPEYSYPNTNLKKPQGNVLALVTDKGLQRILGRQIWLHFDLVHEPAAFNPQRAKFYLAAQVNGFAGQSMVVPLLAKFQCGKGSVIFTSFHNAKNLTPATEKLLLYIVFSAINSEVETKTQTAATMDEFKAHEVKTLNISQGFSLAKQPVVRNKKGKVRLALGFRDGCARMLFRVFTPDGKVIQHVDRSSFVMEIDDAPAGTWHYTVTALEAPFDNFPITVMVAEPKK